ncbi:MAG: hypothetical protein AABP62_25945 [Planctomycetota bacterium]
MCSRKAWLLLFVALAGCGGSKSGPEILKTVSVNGTVTYQNQPLESFQVVFTPTNGRRPSMGRTDASGKFALGTNTPGDGATVGSHKVSVAFDPVSEVDSARAMPPETPADMPKPKVNVPAKFTNPETSETTVEVPAGGLKDYKLELK